MAANEKYRRAVDLAALSYEFVKLVGRHDHTADDGYIGPEDDADAIATLDRLIGDAREIMARPGVGVLDALTDSAPLEWRPIATATRDGKERLLYLPFGGIQSGHWDWRLDCWESTDGACEMPVEAVTHWMPLPPPPSSEEPAERDGSRDGLKSVDQQTQGGGEHAL